MCDSGYFCEAGICAEVPDPCDELCEGKQCGIADTCDCGTCPPGKTCEEGACKAPDVKCEPPCEDGYFCTDGTCHPTAALCTAACKDHDCGAVGDCDCGTCPEGWQCVSGSCQAPEAVCDPECSDGYFCDDGLCTPIGGTYDELCLGKDCGMVGNCDCDACPQGSLCNAVLYACECVPVCVSSNGVPYECGGDGCWGDCGMCPAGLQCIDHECVCPQNPCQGKQCGSDGCGGTCGQCDPGTICTAQKQCVEECLFSGLQFPSPGQKVISLGLGKGGQPGEALDVDGNPATCSPPDNCQSGLDNQLSGLAAQMEQFIDLDEEFAALLEQGDIMIVFDMVDFNSDGSQFTLNIYDALLLDEDCPHMESSCEYLVKPESFEPATCKPATSFDNAKVTGANLTAGGPGFQTQSPFPIPMFLLLPATKVPAYMVQMAAVVSGQGENMEIVDGLFCGAFRKTDMMAAIDMLTPEDPDGLPISKEMLKNLVNMFLVPDMNTDEIPGMDAVSHDRSSDRPW